MEPKVGTSGCYTGMGQQDGTRGCVPRSPAVAVRGEVWGGGAVVGVGTMVGTSPWGGHLWVTPGGALGWPQGVTVGTFWGGSQDHSGGVFVGFLSGGVVIVGSPRGAAVGPPQGSAPWVPVSLLPLGGHSGR